jgi:hypothetical protein
MRRALPISLLVSAIAAGALACSDGNAPASPPRSYQLVSYGGSSLPVTLRVIVESSTVPGGPIVNCDDKLTASKLELLKTEQFTQTDSHLLVCDDGRPDAASQDVLRGTYSTSADSVVLSSAVQSGTQYVSLARISNDGLTIYRREGRSTGGATSIDPTQLVFRTAT